MSVWKEPTIFTLSGAGLALTADAPLEARSKIRAATPGYRSAIPGDAPGTPEGIDYGDDQPAGGQPASRVGGRPALGRDRADVQRRGRDPAAGVGARRAHPRPARRQPPLAAAALRRRRAGSRGPVWQPGRADGQGRA